MTTRNTHKEHTERAGLRLSESIYKQLSAIAEKKNLNLSELIREILTAYVKKYNNPY